MAYMAVKNNLLFQDCAVCTMFNDLSFQPCTHLIRAEFETFDILSDNEVRQGLKKFSNWPTFPQLYVNGELIGGLDILRVCIWEKNLPTTLIWWFGEWKRIANYCI